MRPFIVTLLLFIGGFNVPAQSLDSLHNLIESGRVVDAKLYIDGITDSATQNTLRYQLLKGKLFKELFKQSLLIFDIKNNNWLATSCNAYVDGVTAMAKLTRVPDSLFLILADCYEHTVMEAIIEDSIGSKVLASDLFYAGHYSASLWSLLSGLPIKDTKVQYALGMFFYKQGTLASNRSDLETQFNRARHYLQPLVSLKNEEVLFAIRVIDENLK